MRAIVSGVLFGAVLAAAAGCGGPSPSTASTASAGSGGGAAASTSSTGGPAGTGGANASSSSATASSTGGATASSTGGATSSTGTGGAACTPVDDHNPCTDDVCQGGVTMHVPNSAPCAGGDPCTVGATCQAGACGPGVPLACNGGASCQGGACVAPACTGSLGLPGLPAASQADAVATADFDGDGKPDLAVANGDTDTVTLLFGLGNGSFATPVRFPAGVGPSNLAAADLNGDGKPDLVVVDGGGGTVSVLLNMGGGTFAPPVAYPAGASPSVLGVADLDGDGKPDIAVLDQQDATVSVLLNQGGGAFAPGPDIQVSTGPFGAAWMAVADLDGDGKADLALTVDGGFYPGNVVVLWSQGGGVFSAPTTFQWDIGPGTIVAADVDGDGKVDLVIESEDPDLVTSTIAVALNQGNRTFTGGGGYGVPGFEPVRWMSVADLNGDGKPDLAVVQVDYGVSVLLNQGGGAFALGSTTLLGTSPSTLAVADFDGDGKPDIAVAVEHDTVDLLANQGAGAFAAPVVHYANTGAPLISYPVGMWPIAIAAGDFDGDGRPDLAVAEYTGTGVGVLMNHGDGTFAPLADHAFTVAPADIAAADLDGDGRADIVVALEGSGTLTGSIVVLHSNGDGTFAPPVEVAASPHPSAVILADLNGDGRPDIVAADENGNVLTVLLNAGDGTFPGGSQVSITGPKRVVAADFDGDGKVDLAVAGGTTSVSVLLNQGGGAFGPAVAYPVDPTMGGPFVLAAADFDGDGKPDLVTFIPGGSVVFLWNQGNGTFTVMSSSLGGVGWVLPADLNGDGKPDLVCPGNNAVNVVLNQGGMSFGAATAYSAGDGPSGVAAVDLNGDGRVDLAVADASGNAVTVLLNTCLP